MSAATCHPQRRRTRSVADRCRARGFTLPELVIVVGAIALLIGAVATAAARLRAEQFEAALATDTAELVARVKTRCTRNGTCTGVSSAQLASERVVPLGLASDPATIRTRWGELLVLPHDIRGEGTAHGFRLQFPTALPRGACAALIEQLQNDIVGVMRGASYHWGAASTSRRLNRVDISTVAGSACPTSATPTALSLLIE